MCHTCGSVSGPLRASAAKAEAQGQEGAQVGPGAERSLVLQSAGSLLRPGHVMRADEKSVTATQSRPGGRGLRDKITNLGAGKDQTI